MSSNKMKCLRKLYDKEGLWLDKADIPKAGPFEVLIKVKFVAICGSDIHIYKWNDWAKNTVKLGTITGHEFSGEIVSFGPNAQELNPSLKIGDIVSAEGHITCGYCRNCRAGKQHFCKETTGIGVNRDGAFAEYISMPIGNLYKMPKSIDPMLGSIFDPYGNAIHTATKFDVRGEDVLITGAGPIGCMACAITKFSGARNIVISDINKSRLDLAKKMGATATCLIGTDDLRKVMQDNNIIEGFDVSMEMSGAPQALKTIIDHSINGGRIALLGILPKEAMVDWEKVIFKSLELHGIYGRQMYDNWYKMGAFLESGLDITPIITDIVEFENFENAFKLLLAGDANKIILKF